MAKKRSLLLRFPVYFALCLAASVYRKHPWNWTAYPLSDILIGLAISSISAAVGGLAMWLGANLGWWISNGPDTSSNPRN